MTKTTRLALHWQILIAIALAALAGSLTGEDAALFGVTFYSVYDFVGRLFLNALKMLIVPLIASSMIVGVASLGSGEALGRLGLRTVGFYAATSLCAILLGLAVINVVKPGLVDGSPAGEQLALQSDASQVEAMLSGRSAGDVVEIFVRMIPQNIVSAAGDNGSILAVIFFSLMFGYFMTRVGPVHGQVLLSFWKAVFDVMTRMTEFIMKLAPIGVFGLVAKVVAKAGLSAAGPLAVFAACVLAVLALHLFVVLPLFIRVATGLRPWGFFPAMAPALLTAFSTASSSATVPVTLDCVEKRLGVSNRVSSFVVPLGATVNMNGTALYECAAVLFIAQAYGVDMSLTSQLLVVMLALVTSIGVAGIPAASLVAIAIILTAVGLPPEAIAILFVFDRILDMARTAVNVAGDATAALIVARMEGEKNLLKAP
ncbi:MAG: dicarboxylate/amino acid:cation symporter [Steroidobacteraceae bacterium]